MKAKTKKAIAKAPVKAAKWYWRNSGLPKASVQRVTDPRTGKTVVVRSW